MALSALVITLVAGAFLGFSEPLVRFAVDSPLSRAPGYLVVLGVLDGVAILGHIVGYHQSMS
jgi:hypothetical protein